MSTKKNNPKSTPTPPSIPSIPTSVAATPPTTPPTTDVTNDNKGGVVIGNEKVKGKMKLSPSELKISTMLRKGKRLRFDLAIQRNNVWSDEQNSMLIHSVLDNYPIPQFFTEESDADNFIWMLDGKQRLTAIMRFYNNEFALEKDTPAVLAEDVDGNPFFIEVEGMFYRDLPKELKEEFNDYSLFVVTVRNITSEQREELFQRLNGGTALTKIELLRAKAGEEIMGFINEVASTEFFSKFVSLSKKQRNGSVDSELIMQILALAMGRETGTSSKEIDAFIMALKQDEIDVETKQMFQRVTAYLEAALKQFVKTDGKGNLDMKAITKFTKKIHVPMIFLTARKAIEQAIPAEAFGVWVKGFFDSRYKSGSGEYGRFTTAGSTKSTSVKGRIAALEKDYDAHIEKAVDKAIENAEKRAQEELEKAGAEAAGAGADSKPDPNQSELSDDGSVKIGDDK